MSQESYSWIFQLPENTWNNRSHRGKSDEVPKTLQVRDKRHTQSCIKRWDLTSVPTQPVLGSQCWRGLQSHWKVTQDQLLLTPHGLWLSSSRQGPRESALLWMFQGIHLGNGCPVGCLLRADTNKSFHATLCLLSVRGMCSSRVLESIHGHGSPTKSRNLRAKKKGRWAGDTAQQLSSCPAYVMPWG